MRIVKLKPYTIETIENCHLHKNIVKSLHTKCKIRILVIDSFFSPLNDLIMAFRPHVHVFVCLGAAILNISYFIIRIFLIRFYLNGNCLFFPKHTPFKFTNQLYLRLKQKKFSTADKKLIYF